MSVPVGPLSAISSPTSSSPTSSSPASAPSGVTSRIGYALARDEALPSSSYFKSIHPSLHLPMRMVVLVNVLDMLLLLLPLMDPLAFTAITSITTMGFQISYANPIIQVR